MTMVAKGGAQQYRWRRRDLGVVRNFVPRIRGHLRPLKEGASSVSTRWTGGRALQHLQNCVADACGLVLHDLLVDGAEAFSKGTHRCRSGSSTDRRCRTSRNADDGDCGNRSKPGAASEQLRHPLEVAPLLDREDVCARLPLHSFQHLAIDQGIHRHARDPRIGLFHHLHDGFDMSRPEVPYVQKGRGACCRAPPQRGEGRPCRLRSTPA
jgi:hypothetical protein